jgi:hypothetical protein
MDQWQQNQSDHPRHLPAIEGTPSQDPRKPPACFNCGGPHFKSQCTLPTTGAPQARRQLNFMDREGKPDLEDLSINIIELGTDKKYRQVMNLIVNNQVMEAYITRQRKMAAVSWEIVEHLGLQDQVNRSPMGVATPRRTNFPSGWLGHDACFSFRSKFLNCCGSN